MYDALKDERLYQKVGGPFQLTTLIQKRLVALNKGARPLVETDETDKMAIVIQEILQDKIRLGESGEVETIEGEQQEQVAGPQLDFQLPDEV